MTNSFAPASEAAIGGDLWGVVWKLLRLRVLIFVSGFRRAKLRSKIVMILAVALILIFLGFIFFLSWTLLRFFRSPELVSLLGDIEPVLESVPALIVSGMFIGILLTSFGVLLQALYLAGDMDFLLSAPVPIRAVFMAKLLQAILPNFGLVCLFALPVLYGLGISSGYSFFFYPVVLLVLSALALAAAGLASLFVMLVVRIFPARRVAEVLGFIGAIASFICSQSGQLARWGEAGPAQAQQALKMVTRLNTPWSPLAWASSRTGESRESGLDRWSRPDCSDVAGLRAGLLRGIGHLRAAVLQWLGQHAEHHPQAKTCPALLWITHLDANRSRFPSLETIRLAGNDPEGFSSTKARHAQYVATGHAIDPGHHLFLYAVAERQ